MLFIHKLNIVPGRVRGQSVNKIRPFQFFYGIERFGRALVD